MIKAAFKNQNEHNNLPDKNSADAIEIKENDIINNLCIMFFVLDTSVLERRKFK